MDQKEASEATSRIAQAIGDLKGAFDMDGIDEPPRGFGAALIDVVSELQSAYTKFPRQQASAHEGYAVLLEELDELKKEVFWGENKASSPAGHRQTMRTEAKQVAAMALRFMIDNCVEDED